MTRARLGFCATAIYSLLVAGCRSQTPAQMVRPIDEDLLALVPAGKQLVLDVDVEQLHSWPEGRALFAMLPEAVRAGFSLVEEDVVEEIELLMLAAAPGEAGFSGKDRVLIVRGALKEDRLKQYKESVYRGATIYEGVDRSLAKLAPKLWASAPMAELRRVIDLSRGEGESILQSPSETELRRALSAAPRANAGRAAIIVAARAVPALKDALAGVGVSGKDVTWLSASFAVGDGFDLGAVLGVERSERAQPTKQSIVHALDELTVSSVGRVLGIKQFIDVVQYGVRNDEVHIAYRLSGRRLAMLLNRITRLTAARDARER